MTTRALRRNIYNAMAQQVEREKEHRTSTERSRFLQNLEQVRRIETLEKANAALLEEIEHLRSLHPQHNTITVYEAADRAGVHYTTIWRHLNGQVKQPKWAGYFDETTNRWRVYTGSDQTNDITPNA